VSQRYNTDVNAWIALAGGSIVGGVSRYVVTRGIGERLSAGFPYGTFFVNLSGCLLIGIFHAWAEQRGWLTSEQRLLLMTGFCGAYTTFSSFILEVSQLMRGNYYGRAALYVALSVALGLLVFRLGEGIGRGFSGV